MYDPADIPEKIFTYAFIGRGHYRRRHSDTLDVLSNLYFLFNDTPNAVGARAILQLKEFDAFFPRVRFGVQLKNGYAVTDDVNIMQAGFSDGMNQRVPAIINGEYQLYYPKKVQDACTLPHRYILGCSDCLHEKENPELHCQVKAWYLAQQAERVSPEVTEVIEKWKHLKASLGGYTFVSPTYAGHTSHFAPRRTSVGDISFEHVKRNVEDRKSAAQQRGKVEDFRNQACAHCLVHVHCPTGRAKWCDGPYDKSEDAYYEEILDKSAIPFTNAQLKFMLQRSGRLQRSYNGKDAYLTFRYRDGLQFVLGYLKSGEERPLTFREAKKIIDEYVETPYGVPEMRITKKLKALLVIVTSFHESPTQGSGWHKTRYPVRYTTFYKPYGLIQNFYYRRSNEIASWHFTAENLKDVYHAHERIPLISRTYSPLSLRTRSSFDAVRQY